MMNESRDEFALRAQSCPRPSQIHPRLLDDLENTRQTSTRVQFSGIVARALLVVIGILAISALADWTWVLPRPLRALGAGTALGAAAFVLGRGWPRLDRQQIAAALDLPVPGAWSASSHGRRIL